MTDKQMVKDNPELVHFIEENYLKGYRIDDIAEATGICHTSVWAITNKLKNMMQNHIEAPPFYIGIIDESVKDWIIEMRKNRVPVHAIADALMVSDNCIRKIKYELPKLEKFRGSMYFGVTENGNACRKLTKEQYAWAKERRKEGFSYNDISNALGIERDRAYDYLRHIEVHKKPVSFKYSSDGELRIVAMRAIDANYTIKEIAEKTGKNYSRIYSLLGGYRKRRLVYEAGI